MDNKDWQAAEELALELDFYEAIRFLRSQIGFSLREAGRTAERLASQYPKSKLGSSPRPGIFMKAPDHA